MVHRQRRRIPPQGPAEPRVPLGEPDLSHMLCLPGVPPNSHDGVPRWPQGRDNSDADEADCCCYEAYERLERVVRDARIKERAMVVEADPVTSCQLLHLATENDDTVD